MIRLTVCDQSPLSAQLHIQLQPQLLNIFSAIHWQKNRSCQNKHLTNNTASLVYAITLRVQYSRVET